MSGAAVNTRLRLSAGCVGVVLCGIAICWLSGVRGIFAIDQAIVFDGGWRITRGQVPYVDFQIPFGPVAMWMQAAAFAMLGVSWRTYVLTAGVLNALGALAALRIVRAVLPDAAWLGWLAALSTAAWLYGPMSTTYPEQTAFVLTLVAVALVIDGAREQTVDRWRWTMLFAGGAACGLALLSKTNAGAAGAAAALLVAGVTARGGPGGRIKVCSAVLVGLALTIAGFALWLLLRSDPAAFHESVVLVPGEEGLSRIARRGWGGALLGLVVGKDVPTRGFVVASLIALSGAFVLSWRARFRILRTPGSVGLILLGAQHAFQRVSANDGLNEQPFLAVALACAAGVVVGLVQRSGEATVQRRRVSKAVVALASAGLIGLAAMGAHVSWSRRVQNAFTHHTQFRARAEMPAALHGLRWAEHANPRAGHAEFEHFLATQRAMRAVEGRVLVMGDYTIHYAAAGMPSAGPLVWYHRGLTFSERNQTAIEHQLIDAALDPDMQMIVVERTTYFGGSHLRHFPHLAAEIDAHYEPAETHGLFQLYRRRRSSAHDP